MKVSGKAEAPITRLEGHEPAWFWWALTLLVHPLSTLTLACAESHGEWRLLQKARPVRVERHLDTPGQTQAAFQSI